MQKIRELELKICDFIENAYLWIMDRTGVCVAPLCMISLVLSYELIRDSFNWFDMFLLAINGIFLSARYYLQVKEQYDVLNKSAEEWRHSNWRFWLSIPVGTFFIIVDGTLTAALGWSFMGLYGYLLAVRLRKRDPKHFFEKKEVLAPQPIKG